MAEPRDSLGLALEEERVGLPPGLQQSIEPSGDQAC
jgi:hypothetical protein